ncbi:MAG: pseudouridine synthase, partial [Oscillospiraceae bacterium]
MLPEIDGRTIEFAAEASDDGKTCGDFLRSKGVSRRLLVKLKRVPFGMTREGNTIKTVDTVRTGDIIILKLEDESLLEPNFTLNVPVAYEDSDVIVFSKPAGMPVHPSVRHQGDTLGNCFAAMFPRTTFRPVNRLDKDTSGLCAVAKNAHAANLLSGS